MKDMYELIKEKENASLPPFAEKIKNMFGAKIISQQGYYNSSTKNHRRFLPWK